MLCFKPVSSVHDTSHLRFAGRILVCLEENDSTTSDESECELETEEIVEQDEATGMFGDTPPSGQVTCCLNRTV